ncbi:MAG: GH3 auxin-responsive promoter [Chloroflexi bacterium ADurb.Bin120]|uniref:Uncharacterized protein n=1 Tax=Candidatus Brevifilum fermentans TaxID=1986204 RepID=A0A1Y6K3W8_9CHLR|nr:GH3 auxin-responsive promoter family protein [Brevefilum fermentans]MDI9566819.1 GH3 auxin-responsive promoter family protein [Chloroflexota bacterium]OQB87034.1 MAG: GH3 auxin-responsive promoter [Chloroflexi bacterium ADurb.Bin120]SMX53279.1 protein of unknown function [Brevefilum fermentans]HOM66867.1 GH3 auxin-responsive promoter family protein [Brevefilum fermentans]
MAGQPWQASLENPPAAQEVVLQSPLRIYAQTAYSVKFGASTVSSSADYRAKFPVSTYDDYKPRIERVRAGENELLLHETALGWAITHGITKDETKFIPMTATV